MTDQKKTGLALLREPFPPHQIGKLPKPTKAQSEALKANFKLGQRCPECRGWHQPDVVHLDYIGHAALTDRLLDADPTWTWEPMGLDEAGLPKLDASGGMWIKLTVCGVTRLGYGNAAKKDYGDPGSREKELIGDALRNSAMRFGAALDLWHKGSLHGDEDDDGEAAARPAAKTQPAKQQVRNPDRAMPFDSADHAVAAIEQARTEADLNAIGMRIRENGFVGEDDAAVRGAWKARMGKGFVVPKVVAP